MCGIFGCVDYKGILTESMLRHCTDTMSHRGPNDAGYEVQFHKHAIIGLGHRRLSIIDLSSLGRQPMHFKHLSIVYNGEVYNFKEIRSELEKSGYRFESHTDTEVIIKAFHKWGTSCINKFRGMFAFALYDRQEGSITLVRDRVGVKPLFYYIDENTFMFGSELKPFYKFTGFPKQISAIGLSRYFNSGYIEAPHTIFENTFKIPPGQFARYNIEKRQLNIQPYWEIQSLYNQKEYGGTYDEAQSELETILIESFSLRTIADVPLGIFLSGGIDSTLIAALLQKKTNFSVKTFTIGFEKNEFDEAPFASKIAAFIGAQHLEHYCTIKDTQDIIRKLPEFYDEPFADSSAIPTYLVSQLSKEFATVVLSGDGGDELFCGYSAYDLLTKRISLINKPWLRFSAQLLIPELVQYIPNLKLANRLIKTAEIAHKNTWTEQYQSACSVITPLEIKKLLEKSKINTSGIPELISRTPVENMMLVDFMRYLPDDIMVKVDRATMAVSIEGREPLLDHKIIEFAARLPLAFKHNKKILKSILARYLPQTLFERKKHGFGIPINDWLRTELAYLVEEFCNNDALMATGLFKKNGITKLKHDFYKRHDNSPRMWFLLMFQMWYAKYMA
jgi:asparagine synthase (glutamine-hydrolysing)